MAQQISKSLEAQYKFPRLLHIHLKIKLRNLTLKFRSLKKKFKVKFEYIGYSYLGSVAIKIL